MNNEKDLMNKIADCYCRLSPENLWMDGEATRQQANATQRAVTVELKRLFRVIGRIVSEQEAYEFISRNRNEKVHV